MLKKQISNALITIYFINVLLFIFSTVYELDVIINISFLIRLPIFICVYFLLSKERNFIYFLALIVYQAASIFYTSDMLNAFFYGTISSLVFKFLILLLVYHLVKNLSFLAITLSSLPFFVIYLFLIQFVFSALKETYIIWIINALLTSFIGGIAIVNDLNNSTKKSFWLLLSSILLIIQIGAFFINNFYIKNMAIYQILILAYASSQYTFFRYMLLKETEKE